MGVQRTLEFDIRISWQSQYITVQVDFLLYLFSLYQDAQIRLSTVISFANNLHYLVVINI